MCISWSFYFSTIGCAKSFWQAEVIGEEIIAPWVQVSYILNFNRRLNVHFATTMHLQAPNLYLVLKPVGLSSQEQFLVGMFWKPLQEGNKEQFSASNWSDNEFTESFLTNGVKGDLFVVIVILHFLILVRDNNS